MFNLVSEVDEFDYDVIFIFGGVGVKELREDKELFEIIRNFKKLDKYVFVICDVFNVLYENGIIIDNEVYSLFLIENINNICLKNKVIFLCYKVISFL